MLGESSGNNTNCTLNFVPRMDAARLISGYQSIMRTIYKPSEYYQRALDSLRRTAQHIPEPTSLKLISSLAAFIRLALKLGVWDRERKEFWRFLVHTVRKHRDQFPTSMRLAGTPAFTVTYAGTFYDKRTPAPLFRAVRRLIESGHIDPDYRQRMEIDELLRCVENVS